jgi:hypothetical protein
MLQPFSVGLSDAVGFSKVWNYKGVQIPLDEVHCEFAKDFANVAINSFIDMTLKQAAARKQAEEVKAEPLVRLD